ncbi:MAG TPA: hypothetical protein VFG32_13415 [Bacteroidota bacterium]|nr:hypothetical protein [Bacteroidota bacterium]
MNAPRLLKGGFVYYGSGTAEGNVITFQYNPELLKRTITPIEGGLQPKETIRFTLELDANDALERVDQTATRLGLYPALSALELLVQPRENTGGFFQGLLSWLSQPSSSFVVFIWGTQRVVPVRVLELTVSEQMFDPSLNPIRVSVDVTMETLTEADLKANPKAKARMDSYRINKERLARQSSSLGSVEDLFEIS